MRVFLVNQPPTWVAAGLAREGWLVERVDDLAGVPVDAALVVVGAPTTALILAIHERAPQAAVVGAGLGEPDAELIAVGVDDLLPPAAPADATTRLALVTQRALRRPLGVDAFGDVLELVLFRASATTGDVAFVNHAAFRAGVATPAHLGPGAGWRAAIHPDDLGEVERRRQAALAGAPQTFVYGRSILFGYAIPFTHTGVRLTAAIDERLSVQAMVANGWDVGVDANDAKTFGASALYSDADSGLNLVATALVGEEADEVRVLGDVVIGKRVTERLAVNLNVDVGKDGDATWFGAAAMARFTINPNLNLAARAEHFRDPDGARTGVADGVALTEVTLGAGVPVGGGAEFRFEARLDLADADIFDGGASSTQGTATAAALAWF